MAVPGVSDPASRSGHPGFWQSFGRAQVSSIAATIVDFGTLFASVEILHVWYVLGVALGASLGAVTNFLLGRHWSFKATQDEVAGQAARYALVSGGSLLLNTVGVYAITEGFGLKYGFSKVLTSLLVGVFFNFPLQRRYVFKSP